MESHYPHTDLYGSESTSVVRKWDEKPQEAKEGGIQECSAADQSFDSNYFNYRQSVFILHYAAAMLA